MQSKLNLDQKMIDSARNAAASIAEDVQNFIDAHTTVATERTVVRLLGVDGVDEIGRPLPNVVVDNIKEGGGLERGASFWMGNAMAITGEEP
ncbi:MAG TPA: D-lysine 5,6-aminomutase subunit alpha, partial [Bacteroidales bacterium]|nr:D-lysine 5,6-aminomutase subunit alpha [Bacteroidales bacterium]